MPIEEHQRLAHMKGRPHIHVHRTPFDEITRRKNQWLAFAWNLVEGNGKTELPGFRFEMPHPTVPGRVERHGPQVAPRAICHSVHTLGEGRSSGSASP